MVRRGLIVLLALLPSLAWGQNLPGTVEVQQDGSLIGQCSVLDVQGQIRATDSGGVCPISFVGTAPVGPEELGISCLYDDDEAATINAALGSGGTHEGEILLLPANCSVLIGSAITLGAGSGIAGVDRRTSVIGFAARRCDGGDIPGAACATSGDCYNSGTCVLDGDASDVFAPTSGSSYTGITLAGAESSLQNLTVVVNQQPGESTLTLGNGYSTGICQGGTRDGKACRVGCSAASTLPGFFCDADADCSDVCEGEEQCDTGDCVSTGEEPGSTYAESGAGSGAGSITPVSATGSGARVVDVNIVGHRKGPYSVSITGSYGTVERVNVALGSTWYGFPSGGDGSRTGFSGPTGWVWSTLRQLPYVGTGIRSVGTGNSIFNNVGAGYDFFFSLGGTAERAIGNVALSEAEYGDASQAAWDGTFAFEILGSQAIIQGNNINGVWGCSVAHGGGFNYLFKQNRCFGGDGPKAIVTGSGNQIQNNYMAWASRSHVVALGDPRGRCAAGSRSGLLCLANAGTDATIGCPSSSCAGSTGFGSEIGSTNHAVVSNNIFFSGQHTDIASAGGHLTYLGISPFRYCASDNSPCTSDANCSGSYCQAPTHVNLESIGNQFYSLASTSSYGIDLSPATTYCSVLSSGTGCSNDGDCTSGTCTPSFTNSHFDSTVQGTGIGVNTPAPSATTTNTPALRDVMITLRDFGGTPTSNWDERYGHIDVELGALGTTLEQEQRTFTARATIDPYEAVKVDTANSTSVVLGTSGSIPIGCAVEAAASGEAQRVAVSGKAYCLVNGAVSIGSTLTAGSTAGELVSAGTAAGIGVALESNASGTAKKLVLLRPTRATASSGTLLAVGRMNIGTGASYFGMFDGGDGTPQTNELNVNQPVGYGITITEIACCTDNDGSAFGSGDEGLFVLRKNGGDTGLACSIVGPTAACCTDTTPSVVVSAGDRLDYSYAETGTVTANTSGCTAKYTLN